MNFIYLLGGFVEINYTESFEKIQIEQSIYIKQDSIINKNELDNLKNYFCGICSALPTNPMMCFNCQLLFCSSCLQKHLKTDKYYTCPGCKHLPFMVTKLTEPVIKILMGINIRCPFECGIQFRYENLKTHVIDCDKSEKYYKCKWCDVVMRAKAFDEGGFNDHIITCPSLNKNCIYCKKVLQGNESENHGINCSKKYVKCKKCHAGYLNEHISAHRDYYCPLITSILESVNY
jgi:hypothetical protein